MLCELNMSIVYGIRNSKLGMKVNKIIFVLLCLNVFYWKYFYDLGIEEIVLFF